MIERVLTELEKMEVMRLAETLPYDFNTCEKVYRYVGSIAVSREVIEIGHAINRSPIDLARQLA